MYCLKTRVPRVYPGTLHSKSLPAWLDTPLRTGAKRRDTPRTRGAKSRTQKARYGPFEFFIFTDLKMPIFHPLRKNFSKSVSIFSPVYT